MIEHTKEYSGDDPVAIELMRRSALDIQMAGYDPEENIFLAAHSSSDSIIAMRIQGELTVWQVSSGDKSDRVKVTANIRGRLKANNLTRDDS